MSPQKEVPTGFRPTKAKEGMEAEGRKGSQRQDAISSLPEPSHSKAAPLEKGLRRRRRIADGGEGDDGPFRRQRDPSSETKAGMNTASDASISAARPPEVGPVLPTPPSTGASVSSSVAAAMAAAEAAAGSGSSAIDVMMAAASGNPALARRLGVLDDRGNRRNDEEVRQALEEAIGSVVAISAKGSYRTGKAEVREQMERSRKKATGGSRARGHRRSKETIVEEEEDDDEDKEASSEMDGPFQTELAAKVRRRPEKMEGGGDKLAGGGGGRRKAAGKVAPSSSSTRASLVDGKTSGGRRPRRGKGGGQVTENSGKE